MNRMCMCCKLERYSPPEEVLHYLHAPIKAKDVP